MKRIVFLVTIIILFFFILRLITSIYTLWHKQDLLTNAKEQLTQEKRENTALHQQFAQVNSPQFVEKEARDKLLLVKPGESDVLIDQELLKASASAATHTEEKSNWQQWWDLFFGK